MDIRPGNLEPNQIIKYEGQIPDMNVVQQLSKSHMIPKGAITEIYELSKQLEKNRNNIYATTRLRGFMTQYKLDGDDVNELYDYFEEYPNEAPNVQPLENVFKEPNHVPKATRYKQPTHDKQQECKGNKPIKNPLTGQCISFTGGSIKKLYNAWKADNIKKRFDETENPTPIVIKSIEGARVILSKYDDDELTKIRTFFRDNVDLKNELDKCDKEGYEKRINAKGAVLCMVKITEKQERERKKRKKRKKVKRADCSDYVYSSKHKKMY